MNKSLVSLSVGLLFIAVACTGLVSEQGHPCPCSSEWVCCASTNVCIPEGTACAPVDSGTLQNDGALGADSPAPTDASTTSSSSSGGGTSSSSGSGSSSGSVAPVACGADLVPDASGFLNPRCDMCIDTNCQSLWCQCFDGVPPEQAGTTPQSQCGVYVDCVYSQLLQASLAGAKAQNLNSEVTNAEAACQPDADMSSITAGNALVACIGVNNCDPTCVGL